jgi:hypothetical protein
MGEIHFSKFWTFYCWKCHWCAFLHATMFHSVLQNFKFFKWPHYTLRPIWTSQSVKLLCLGRGLLCAFDLIWSFPTVPYIYIFRLEVNKWKQNLQKSFILKQLCSEGFNVYYDTLPFISFLLFCFLSLQLSLLVLCVCDVKLIRPITLR